MDLRGQTLDGRYKVLEMLGRGGMGSVWLVQHVQSHERYALKVLHPELATDRMTVERFVREARAASAFKSRHVVKIVDAQRDYVGEDGLPLPYLVMELLEGKNLEVVIARRGALPREEVLWMMRQIGKALDLAHERGIVHRDLKPENIFIALDEEGAPVSKLCDFGIAKVSGESAGLMMTGAMVTGGISLGTPMYMSPEQVRDSSEVDARTDQWALGLIAFKALTGREYFAEANTHGKLMGAILVDPLPKPSRKDDGLPEGFDAWFLRSCARDPNERWPRVREQIEALDAALGVSTAAPIALPKGSSALESAATGAVPATPDALPTGAPATTTRNENKSRNVRVAIAAGSSITLLVGVLALASSRQPVDSTTPSLPASVATFNASTASSPSAPASPSTSPIVASAEPAAPVAASTQAPTPTKAKPKPSATASVAPPAPSPSSPAKTKLAKGAPCARGGECASGYCFAEQCQ